MKVQSNLMLLTAIAVLLSTAFQPIPYATVEKIMNTAPNARYTIDADDAFVTPPEKGIVIFEMDDPQEDWLEDITVQLTETHISKGVDVVLGVLPWGLNRSWDESLSKNLKDWYANHSDVVEIDQQGYNDIKLAGKSYEEQRENIKNGLDVFQRYGIRPYTFTPPFSSADNITVRVLEDLGFHTLQDNRDHNLVTRNLTVIGPGVRLTKDSFVGLNSTIKSAEEIINEIDQVIEERCVTPVFYHVQDFRTEDDMMNYTKYNQFLHILDRLKTSGKYQFMTSEEYHQMRRLFSDFKVTWEGETYHITTMCNSTISNFDFGIVFNETKGISFYVTGEDGTIGCCRVCIPHDLMSSPYTVIINDGQTPVLDLNDNLYDNGTHRWIYLVYQHSTHKVVIIPEFPPRIILPLLTVATLLAVIVHRRKHPM